MFNYLLAICGLAVLCAAWGFLQIWLRKYNSNTIVLKSGCSTCDKASCAEKE